MRHDRTVTVIIPALNEAEAIPSVLRDIPKWVDQVIVADNGSTDDTADLARAAGAQVVPVPQRGYGAACLGALAALGDADVVVFLDADYSDDPKGMHRLVDPILRGDVELVLGSRTDAGRDVLTVPQRFGNRLACVLIRWIWGQRYCDLGPFRAIERGALERLDMKDTSFGWTVEMQIKAARLGLRVQEVEVPYRPRIGQSKISGTVIGTVRAGYGILSIIAVQALARGR